MPAASFFQLSYNIALVTCRFHLFPLPSRAKGPVPFFLCILVKNGSCEIVSFSREFSHNTCTSTCRCCIFPLHSRPAWLLLPVTSFLPLKFSHERSSAARGRRIFRVTSRHKSLLWNLIEFQMFLFTPYLDAILSWFIVHGWVETAGRPFSNELLPIVASNYWSDTFTRS